MHRPLLLYSVSMVIKFKCRTLIHNKTQWCNWEDRKVEGRITLRRVLGRQTGCGDGRWMEVAQDCVQQGSLKLGRCRTFEFWCHSVN
jgi:hypothetical protein